MLDGGSLLGMEQWRCPSGGAMLAIAAGVGSASGQARATEQDPRVELGGGQEMSGVRATCWCW
jgi:hypothetical protein